MIGTYSLKPILRIDKLKKDNTCPVNFRISFSGNQIKVPTGISGEEKNWDKLQRVFSKSELNYNNKNRLLLKLKSDFDTYVTEKKIAGENLSDDLIKNFFNSKKPKEVSFYSFFEYQIKLWRVSKRQSTLEGYKFSLSVLKQFKPEMSFQDINLELLQKYELYLYEKRGVNLGGASNRLKHFRAVIMEGIRKNVIKESPFSNGKFSIKRPPHKTKFLNESQIKAIENVIIPEKRSALEYKKDMFLFSCYTGLRYSDMQGLKWSYIKNGKIEMKTLKTGSTVNVPLCQKALEILEKYKEIKKENVFPKITNQKLNYALRSLLKLAGIEERFSFHDSRHAFACSLVAKDVPLIVVRDLMGHSSIKETDKYAKLTNTVLEQYIAVLDN